MAKRHFILAYDVTDHKRRQRLFSLLKKQCLARQKSVFEFELSAADQARLYWSAANIVCVEDEFLMAQAHPKIKPILLGNKPEDLFQDMFYLG